MGLDMFLNKVVEEPKIEMNERGVVITDSNNVSDIIEPRQVQYITFKNGTEVFIWDLKLDESNKPIATYYDETLKDHVNRELDFTNISKIKYEVAYWRKANSIHKWFVDNIQNGIDDCNEYQVSYEQIQELIDTCNAVLNSPNKVLTGSNLLQTQAGFFFGGTDYDEYYFQDLADTVKQLSFIHKTDKLFYRSSW